LRVSWRGGVRCHGWIRGDDIPLGAGYFGLFGVYCSAWLESSGALGPCVAGVFWYMSGTTVSPNCVFLILMGGGIVCLWRLRAVRGLEDGLYTSAAAGSKGNACSMRYLMEGGSEVSTGRSPRFLSRLHRYLPRRASGLNWNSRGKAGLQSHGKILSLNACRGS
jgi:hypothetical protein